MPQPRRSSLKVAGGVGGDSIPRVSVTIEGLEKTHADFKAARREINKAMRDAQRAVGERVVLPLMRSRMRPYAVHVKGHRIAVAETLRVRPDRLDVYIGSGLTGASNRAVGWLDFGGQRPGDSVRRAGPLIMVRTVNEKQPEIRDRITDAVLDQFRRREFDVR